MKSKYDLILYDLDGTLIDSVPAIMNSFKMAYTQVLGKCERSDEDLMSYIGKPLVESFKMHDEATAQKLFDTYLDINCGMLRDDLVEMFPNVMDGIIKLNSMGVNQGVVTSKKFESADITMKIKGLYEFMTCNVFNEDTSIHKPEAQPLLCAAAKAGIKDMSRVLYVGDALADGLCAKNAGADFVLVDWSMMDKESIIEQCGGRIIKSIDEIVYLIY